METTRKILLKLPLPLRNVILKLLYLLCDIELFIIDVAQLNEYAWNTKTLLYYPICSTMFNDDTINYGYKHDFSKTPYFFGKIQNKQIMMIR
jgi:hypothetical protein